MSKIDTQKAIAILNEAKNHDIIDEALPEDEETQIKLAIHLVKQARRAKELGENGTHVKSILFIADSDLTRPTSSDSDDDDDESRYQELIREHIEDGLPIPEVIEGEVPSLPLDLGSLSDREVMFLHGAYNACSARIAWLFSLEEAGEYAAKFIADHYEQEYLVNADRKDIGGKPKTNALLRAEAEEKNPELVKWRNREQKHKIQKEKKRRLLEAYDNNCERLSRHWTMRIQEREGANR